LKYQLFEWSFDGYGSLNHLSISSLGTAIRNRVIRVDPLPAEHVLNGERRKQMINPSEIREHAEVFSADGNHVGIVDRVEAGRIKLTRSENDPGHQDHHHFIGLAKVASVEEGRVVLSVAARDAIEEEDGAVLN
jgi:hypothetical protein